MSNTELPPSAGEPVALAPKPPKAIEATEPPPLIRWDNVVEETDLSPEAKQLIGAVHSQR